MGRRRKAKNTPEHRVIYWDACIWIAWLNMEQRPPGDMEGVITSVDHVAAGRCTLVASVILPRLEVPQDRMTREVQALFSSMLERPNVVMVDLEAPIMQLQKDLVRFYEKEERTGVNTKALDYWDAGHLATAINRKVDAFYTFDNGKRDKLGLLGLNGNVAGYPLTICRPPFTQAPLLF